MSVKEYLVEPGVARCAKNTRLSLKRLGVKIILVIEPGVARCENNTHFSENLVVAK